MEDKQTPRTLVRTAIKNITQRSETPLLDHQDVKERYETPAPRPSDVTKELSMLAGQPLVYVLSLQKSSSQIESRFFHTGRKQEFQGSIRNTKNVDYKGIEWLASNHALSSSASGSSLFISEELIE